MLAGAMLVVGLLLAACGGDDPPAIDETPAAPAAPATNSATTLTLSATSDASEGFLLPADLRAADEFGWSGATDGEWMAVSAPFHDAAGPQSGSVFLYRLNGEVWSEAGRLIASDTTTGDWFGRWVTIQGDTMVASSPFADLGETLPDAGTAYVFALQDGVWVEQAKLSAALPFESGLFGFTMEIDGDALVVGSPGNRGDKGGVAYVFRREGGVWTQEAFLEPPDTIAGNGFGFYVDLEGDTLVVGAPSFGDPTRDGKAYVYERREAGWFLAAQFLGSPRSEGDAFGSAVAVEGGLIAVGAFHANVGGDDSGAVSLFERPGASWGQGGERGPDVVLLGNDTTGGDWFGYALDLRDGALAVGAPSRPHPDLPVTGVGAVYLFGRAADAPWQQHAILVPGDGESAGGGAGFGWDVWLGPRHVGVGSWLADNVAGVDAGAAYVYRLAGPLDGGAAIADPIAEREPVAPGAPSEDGGLELTLVPTFGGQSFPDAVEIVWLPDGTALVAERSGRISAARPDGSDVAPALDLSGRVADGPSESGLLALAVDPQFATNGALWLYYAAAPDGALRLSRFSATGAVIDPESELVALEIPATDGDVQGGTARFGPDGMLYLAVSAGEADGEPAGDGQNLATLRGSVLRLDVSAASVTSPYAIPADNPFSSIPAARAEVWAYGFHDPRRMEFDLATGALWVSDVGHETADEINRVVAGGNYGWNLAEGSACTVAGGCDLESLEQPVLSTPHERGCGIIGGPVYRGGNVPGLAGVYIFSELCTGVILGLEPGSSGPPLRLALTERTPSGFAAGPDGGLFFMTPGSPVLEVLPLKAPATADVPYFSEQRPKG